MRAIRTSVAALQLFLVSAGVIGCDVQGGKDQDAEVGEGEDGKRVVKPGMVRQAPITHDRDTNQSNVFGECSPAEYVWTAFPDGTEGWLPLSDRPGKEPAESEIPNDGKDNNCNGLKDEESPCTPGHIEETANHSEAVCDEDGNLQFIETPATVIPADEQCNGEDDNLNGKVDDSACSTEQNPDAAKECDDLGKPKVGLSAVPTEDGGEVPATSATVCAVDDQGNTSEMAVAGPEPIPGFNPTKTGDCELGATDKCGGEGACTDAGFQEEGAKQFCVQNGNGGGTWTECYGGQEPVQEPRGDGQGQADKDCDGGSTLQRLKAKIVCFFQ